MSKLNICGIYVIKNKIDNKLYIGSSKSVYYRWKQQHYPQLKNNRHYNGHLQNAWNKFGEDNFEFQVLEECQKDILAEREEYWIEYYKSWNSQYGYNLTRIINGHNTINEEYRKIYWTSGKNKEILDLYKQGISKNKIAKQLGVKRNTVYNCLEYHGLYKNEGKGNIIKLTNEVKQCIYTLREEGMSLEDIFKQVGISKTQFYRALKIKDGKFGGNKNIRKSYRTFTPEIKERAIILRNQGKTWQEIGEELGISRQLLLKNGITKGQQRAKEKPTKKITQEIINEAIELRKQGQTWRVISKKFGCSENAFQCHIPHGTRKIITQEILNQAIKLKNQGCTWKIISKNLECSINALKQNMEKYANKTKI